VTADTQQRGLLADRRRRRALGLVALVAGLAAVVFASIATGAKPVSVAAVWHALTSPSGTVDDIVVRSLRLPRTALGVLVGIALGTAGALMQGHTRNPIADPGLLGVTQGAGFSVVFATYAWGITSLYGSVWFGFAGALLAGAVVFAVGSVGRGGPTPLTLVLAGAALSSLLLALTSALVLLDQQSLDTYRFWKVGSIAARDPMLAAQVFPFVAVGVIMALANAPGLNTLALGTDVARSLGQRMVFTKVLGLAATVVLTGSAVAACGPIGFVGLVAPHIARMIAGADYRWLLPYSALLGAVLVLLADVVGRLVAAPRELQVGIVLAMIGAPFFIGLIRRRKVVRL
jgi:iron complex transport system permease protein